MPSWTVDQEKAIKARGSNLLVAAAAGSGKTAVLVERILQLIIQDEVDIDRLLIVTFTNAAAGEMRERIANAIAKELENKGPKEAHIRKQLTLLSKASIMTLHAFCIEVVRKHFHIIDIDPGFRIGDTTETAIMQMEVMEELFEEGYREENPLFLELVESYGGSREDLPLQNMILNLYSFIQSQPHPLSWLEEKILDFQMTTEDFEESQWMKTIKESIDIRLREALLLLAEAKIICEKPDGPAAYMTAIDSDTVLIKALQMALQEGIDAFYSALQGLKHVNLKPVKDCDEVLKEEAKALRDQAKGIIKKLQEDYFSLSPEEYLKDLNALYPSMSHLSKLVAAFGEGFKARKLEKGIVDFNDLEHYALEILENPLVAKDYRERFQYIFIDEYQDSNIVQETIINSIKRDNNVFMVGDVKQSIYRFRLADPSLFIEKYEAFSAEGIHRRIDLSRNFRSRREILEGVNYLFKNLMTKHLGEIDYTEEAYLYYGADFQPMEDTDIEVTIIEKDYTAEEDELEEEIEELEDIEVEAKIAASRIKGLLNTQIFDVRLGDYRKVEFKDIVILLRTTQNWAPVFLETLVKEGIPTYADANTGYFQALEINLFMNFLRVLDNKRQDIPLISLMRSPIGRFKVEELIEIRLANRKGSFYEALMTYCEEAQGGLRDNLVTFLQRLEGWSEEARYMPLDEFIWKLLMESGYYHYVGAMPGGLQRQANLRILMDRATQFQRTSIKGLFNFILFIEKLQSSRGDMGSAKILSENDNVVRIMSIHKSKGLEFPIVIVAGMGKNFNLTDINNAVILHKSLGLGPNYVDHEKRFYRDSIAKLAVKERIKIESLSEEMRVLYVALTRPKDKLILLGSLRNLPRHCKRWCRGLNTFNLLSAKSYLDWIGSALMKHPDGEALREIVQLQFIEAPKQEESRWRINLTDRRELMREKLQQQKERQEYRERLENYTDDIITPYRGVIEERLQWQYPHRQSALIPSKVSVTEIKQGQYRKVEELSHKIPPLVKLPKFIEGTKAFTPAERGTILHFVLQHLDLSAVSDLTQIQGQVASMLERELLTQPEAEIVEIEKILTFFESDIGIRMLRAKKVYRETAFNLKKPAVEVLENLEDCDEALLIQGVIDCYFEEASGLVLLDYKSDFVPEEGLELIINKYRPQLQLYHEALTKITGKAVKEKILYLFSIGRAVALD